MRTELGIIKMLQGIFHVVIMRILHNTSAIFEDISKLNVTSIPHVVLEILPTTSRRQSRYQDTVLRATWRRAPSISAAAAATTTTATTKSSSTTTRPTPTSTTRKLHSNSLTIKFISIPSSYCIFSIPTETKTINKSIAFFSTLSFINY